MKKFLSSIMAWMLAHPVIEHLLEGAIYAVLLATVAYIKTGLADPTHAITMGGLSAAVLLAFKAWLSLNQTLILAQVQDAVSIPASGTQTGPQPTTSAALTPAVKMVLFLVGFAFLAGPSFAGYVFTPAKSDKVGLSLPSGTALYLMPIEGFDVGIGLPKPTYGLSVNEDVVFGVMTSVSGSPNISPLFGVGASLYLDGADVINGDGKLVLMGGVNVLGPDLDLLGMGNGQGLVPHVMFVRNFDTGENKAIGGLTAFIDLGPGTAVKLTK